MSPLVSFLIRKRLSNNLSYKELASRCGNKISARTFQRILSGDAQITENRLNAIAEAFSLSTTEVVLIMTGSSREAAEAAYLIDKLNPNFRRSTLVFLRDVVANQEQ